MNGNIGPGARYDLGWTLQNPVTKMGNFTVPGPSVSWVFLDEHPDSIDDAQFYINPGETNGTGTFTELPASYHNNGGGINFADGHAEIHRWMDYRTIQPVKLMYNTMILNVTASPDLAWLAQHTPYQQ